MSESNVPVDNQTPIHCVFCTVERLIKINQECEQEAHIQDEILRRYKAENAKLRAVVEAARGIFLGEGEHLCSEFEEQNMYQNLVKLIEKRERDLR